MATGTIKKYCTDIARVVRVAETVTTGATGNIATPYLNDGKTAIFSPYTNGGNYAVRSWVADSTGSWYLTVINPNTGATINNASINIRYWVVTFTHT